MPTEKNAYFPCQCPWLSRSLLAALVVFLAFLAGCATVEPFSGESVDLAVEHMLHAVGEAARISGERSGDSFDLELSQISVTVETIAQRQTSGEFTLWIATFEASREHDFTQSITVLLKPPEPTPTSRVLTERRAAHPYPDMVEKLAHGFDAAYLAARGARDGLRRSHPGEAPLATSTITVTVNFTVSGSASATPTIEILGIDLTGSRSGTRENVHQITMIFKKKSAGKDSSKKSPRDS